MRLLQVIVELRHSERLRLFRPYEELYRSLTEKELPEKETVLPGFQLNIVEKKMRVIVDPERIVAVLGDVPNIGYCVDNVAAVFRKTGELVKLPPVLRLGTRSYWIKQSEISFGELVSAFKKILYKPNIIVDQSVDVGASFTLSDDKYAATVYFGPMELSQLKGRLLFEPSQLPDVVIFLDVDYYLGMEPSEVTERTLRDFITTGLNYAEQQAARLTNILLEG